MPLDARTTPVRFGIFEVDLAAGELRKRGVRVKLQEQPFLALAALIERPREVLTREELQKRLWPADTNVDFERGLNKAINRVREALGDDADDPRFIETLPQRGYRFLAQIESPSQSLSRRIESLAVLPLENLSGSAEQEYFSDGMTDELIGQIARIGSLRVISRTSIMQYKGSARKSLPSIARELNVDAILEGTVVHSGQRVRITAQLIRAEDDRHLWSEKYERDLTDVLALQTEVARAVAAEIEIKVAPHDATSLARKRPVNSEAYEAFLRGNFFLHHGIRGTMKSIEFFTEAIAIDPLHADSYVGLAQALCFAGIFGFRPSSETYPEARRAALKALELDETSAGAHNVLADVKQGYDWDLPGAEREFQRAIELNPSHLLTRLWYAESLTRMGRYDEALEESDRALALDPVSPISHNNRAMLLFRARRFDEAIQVGAQALDLDPSFVNGLWWQGVSYAGKGEFPRAITCLTKAAGMNDGPLFRALLGHVYGLAGDRPKALGMLEEITGMSGQRFVSPVDFAVIHAGLGDADATFHWMEKAYQARAIRVLELRSPYFDSFRSDPRYADLSRRLRLPAAEIAPRAIPA